MTISANQKNLPLQKKGNQKIFRRQGNIKLIGRV